MNPSKNRGLGKGLEALFADVEIDVGNEKNKTNKNNEGVSFVDINMIKPSGYQPRKTFGEDKIDELAKSIEAHGIIQPIVIRKAGAGYEIVAGERRWRAARKAGLKDVPCLIREFTDEQNALVSLIENMQREDLNAMEEAAGLERMIAILGLPRTGIEKHREEPPIYCELFAPLKAPRIYPRDGSRRSAVKRSCQSYCRDKGQRGAAQSSGKMYTVKLDSKGH